MKTAIEKLQKAKHIVFFTGAGVSAESGIPTFRGEDGIWTKLKPEELANFDAFLRNTELVWEWYKGREEITKKSQPNNAHLAIAALENYVPKVTVVTQNIDNMHKRAGSSTVYELHGNLERNYCIKCHRFYNGDLNIMKNKVPHCECGGLIRPDIVWFGEMLPEDQYNASQIASENCDVFFMIGTTGVVYPAANMIHYAKQSGAYLIEMNVEKTDVSYLADLSLIGKAGEILPGLLKEAFPSFEMINK